MSCRIDLFNQGLNVPVCDVQHIYERCNWGSGDIIIKAIKNSFCTAIAYHCGEPVGIARMISDGVSYGLLVDTMVIDEHQRQGIGKKIVNELLSFCRSEKIHMVKLISSKEGIPFYKELGFKECGQEGPGMVLQL